MPYNLEAKDREKDQSATDPCYKERRLSLKCMDVKGYTREHCVREFENFKNCKSFWTEVIRERKHDNITPHIPPLEERDAIFKAKFKLPKWVRQVEQKPSLYTQTEINGRVRIQRYCGFDYAVA